MSDSPSCHPVPTKIRASIKADFKLWEGGKEGESKLRLSFFICLLLSLSARIRHRGRFLGRLGPATCRGPDEAHVSGQAQRHATTQPFSNREEES